jgi:hypothetical protein
VCAPHGPHRQRAVDARSVVTDGAGGSLDAQAQGHGQSNDLAAALQHVIGWLKANLADTRNVAAGHTAWFHAALGSAHQC